MQETMSARAWGGDRRVLILALGLGAISAGLIVAFLGSRESGSGTGSGVTTLSPVVVATREIAVGSEITASMVTVRELPSSALISDGATSLSEVLGETARYPISAGEQLSVLRLVEPPKTEALSFQIPDGLRGFTIPVSNQDSPASVLVPGDFVDVLVAGSPEGLVAIPSPRFGADEESSLRAVVTLLQNVQVLAVQREYIENGVPYDASVRGDLPAENNVGFVTLALTPEQSQVLWLALQDGQITLALRSFGDAEINDLAPVSGPLAALN